MRVVLHRRVVLESDSTEAIDCVLGSCKGNEEDEKIINDCKELISREWIVIIKHIGRRASQSEQQGKKLAFSNYQFRPNFYL